MKNLLRNAEYSPSELWKNFFPNRPVPVDDGWCSDYISTPSDLVFFIDVTGEALVDRHRESMYDATTGIVQWFGRPNSHSEQPRLKRLREGKVSPLVFVRFLGNRLRFTFLGQCTNIIEIVDNSSLSDGKVGLSIKFSFDESAEGKVVNEIDAGPEGLPIKAIEGHKQSVSVNRYERSPLLRAICLDAKGCVCEICEFDFEKSYGELGRQYCHVHHIKPLSELDGEIEVDPIMDLMPVCANCHSMLHRVTPALQPAELFEMIKNAKVN